MLLRATNRALVLMLIVLPVKACTTFGQGKQAAGNAIADVFLPSDVPPRPGTIEYDRWQAERAAEAVRPKTARSEPE